MAILTKVFNGAQLNSNDSHEYMAPTDLVDGSGVRIQSEEGNSQGLVKTLEGNRQITRGLPAGTNTILRAKTFPEVRKTYIFTKNSNGNHRIEEFDYVTESFTTIYEDLTDSGTHQLLDWQGVLSIKDVVLVQGVLLCWTEFPTGSARRLYVDRAKGGGYGTFTPDDFYLSVPPPTVPPSFYYISDGDLDYNNIRGNLFQFRYRYLYGDEHSSWSPMSDRRVPTNEPAVETDTRILNATKVYIPLQGDRKYTGIEVSARIGNGDWFSVKTVERGHIGGLPIDTAPIDPDGDTVPQFDVLQEFRFLDLAPDPGGYGFVFYNDGLYPTDDQLEHNLLSDDVPDTVRAMESVNDNTLLLGNVGVGKVTPDSSLSVEVAFVQPDMGSGGSPLRWGSWGDTNYVNFYVSFHGNPSTGDEITLNFQVASPSPPPPPTSVTHVVTSLEDGDLMAAVTGLMDDLPNSPTLVSKSVSVLPDGVLLSFTTGTFSPLPNTNMRYMRLTGVVVNNTVATGGRSIPSVKMGSSYELAVAYYDRYGRPFPLGNTVVAKTPPAASLQGGIPVLDWYIAGNPPPGAETYHILASPNRTHANSIYTIARMDADKSTDDIYWFDVTPLFNFNGVVNSGNLAYDFSPGDRVNIVANVDASGDYTNWVSLPVRNCPVLSVEVDAENPSDTRYYMRVGRPAGEPDVFDPDETVVLEVYTPNRESGIGVLYEVSECFHVVSGKHSVVSGRIDGIDSYYKIRRMKDNQSSDPLTDTREFFAEDLHFSDMYPSKFGRFGRPRIQADTDTPHPLKTTIRYSREWISGSRINGIVRFYPEDSYDTREPDYGAQENYGGIQYLQNRENRLICVQELKVGYIPVNRSIIEDTVEQQQIGISSKLLNPISYYAGPNIGIGNDYAVTSFLYVNGSCYFVDPVEMLPVRAGLDGTRYIGYKYSGALKAKIRQHIRNGGYIKSLFDDRFNEWLLLFTDTTWTFDEKIDGWVPKKPYLPESGFSADDRFYTFDAGALYVHDDEVNRNVFYGTAYPAEISFSVTSPGVKTFRSIEQHSDDLMVTEEMGVETQLGQTSELNLTDDYDWNGEGVYLSNLLFDGNSPGGIPNGDLLKGRWILFKLRREAGSAEPIGEINLLKLVVKDTYSTPNIT